jgi:signal peptidase
LKNSRNYKRALVYLVAVLLIVGGAQIVLVLGLGATSFAFIVISQSMHPTLEIGDMVFVQNVPYDSIKIGDVVVFNTPNVVGTGCTDFTVVHRVVNTANGGLITQGDNRFTNPSPDEPGTWPPVPAPCVRGKVIFVIPYLGKISELFPPPYNYLVIALILIVVFLSELKAGGDRRPADDKGAPVTLGTPNSSCKFSGDKVSGCRSPRSDLPPRSSPMT